MRLSVVIVTVALLLQGRSAIAQATPTGPHKIKADLLDQLLPVENGSRPWFDRFVIRFSNPIDDYGEVPRLDGQVVLLTYPVDPPAHQVPECELIASTVRSKTGEDLSTLIRRKRALDPNVSEGDIAHEVVVDVNRRPISMKERDKILAGLKRLRLSPVLATRICLDNCPRYDYWHDTGSEVVHYTLYGHGTHAQDRLTAWIDNFLSVYVDSPKAR